MCEIVNCDNKTLACEYMSYPCPFFQNNFKQKLNNVEPNDNQSMRYIAGHFGPVEQLRKLSEEISELQIAMQNGDMSAIVDELIDVYTLSKQMITCVLETIYNMHSDGSSDYKQDVEIIGYAIKERRTLDRILAGYYK